MENEEAENDCCGDEPCFTSFCNSIDECCDKSIGEMAPKFRAMLISLGVGIAYFMVTAIFLMYLEDWTLKYAVWMNMITFTTIGYGISTEYPIVWSIHVLAVIVLLGAVVVSFCEIILATCSHHTGSRVNKRCCKCWNNHVGNSWIIYLLWFSLTLGFMIAFVEDFGVSWEQAWFMAVQTMTTVGYGDVTPDRGTSAWLIIFFSPFLLIAFTACVSTILASLFDVKESVRQAVFRMSTKKTWEEMEEMFDMDSDNEVSKEEFMVKILQNAYGVTEDEMKEIEEGYEEFRLRGQIAQIRESEEEAQQQIV